MNTKSSVSFAGHETFVFRYGWLKKAVDEAQKDASVFSAADAMVRLGVGKNMVRSIRHWATACQVIRDVPGTRGRQVEVTSFGDFMFGKDGCDPYLEDPTSLWLLHWNLGRNEEKATTWAWLFGLLTAAEFTKDSLVIFLKEELERRALSAPSENTLDRDVDCFLRTYTGTSVGPRTVMEDSLDCPLVELGLIEEIESNTYRFNRIPRPALSNQAFAYSLIEFWDASGDRRNTLAFTDAAYGAGSPGAIFKLDENSLVERLERLENVTDGALIYGETAGLKQIYKHRTCDPFELLNEHYRVLLGQSEVTLNAIE